MTLWAKEQLTSKYKQENYGSKVTYAMKQNWKKL